MRRSGIVTAGLLTVLSACGARSELEVDLGAAGTPSSGEDTVGGGGSVPPDVRIDGTPVEDIEDPEVRGRVEQCAGYCSTILDVSCEGRSLAGDRVECIESCADQRGRCARDMLGAFACIAGSASTAVICDENGPEVRCGPCDDALQAVASACNADEIQCTFQ